MKNKDFSTSPEPKPSAQPEGIFAEEDALEGEIEIVSTAQKPASPSPSSKEIEGGGEGIDLDRSRFEEGDIADAIGFAPNDDDPLPVQDESDTSLAFDDLTGEKLEEDSKKSKIVHKKIVRHEKGGFIKGISATLIYLLLVVCAGLLSGLIVISVANDVFAFSKDDTVYELVIDDPDMSLDELADYLHEEGIIRYPFIFRLYVGLKDEGEFKLNAGTFSISPSYNYDMILTCLNPPPVRTEIDITFSEGLTVDDIIDIFIENGIGTRAGFVDAIENHRFDYWFLKDLETTEDRFYRLEGYLYPDTYRFYSDSSEVAALTKMLDNFEKKVPKTYQARCEELGMTLDEAVILASIVEAECARINDLEHVSAVFHNRFNSAEFDGLLGSDATIQYYLRHTTGTRKPELTAADLALDTPYNSRIYKGLPPGAICNPSLNSLMAAVYPIEDCDEEDRYSTCPHYYFVAQSNGYNLYAKTLDEHNQNIEQVRKENETN